MVLLCIIFSTSCESGNAISKWEIGSFPDNIVYYAGEVEDFDLTGMTLISTTIDGRRSERSISILHSEEIIHNINFSVPGVYEIHIIFELYGIVARIPIQVTERE